MSINTKKISIAIPVFNECNTVAEVLTKVIEAKLGNNWQKEIIIVDDGSSDGTTEILKTFRDRCTVILKEKNGGKGAALKTAFEASTGDYILIQDADTEYNPDDFVYLLRPIEEKKADVVFGSRTLRSNNVPFSRVYFYGGLLVTKVFNMLHRSRITDLATCYKVFPRRYVDEINKMPANDFVFDVVQLSYVLLRKVSNISEVPITYISRHKEEGKKMNWKHGLRCVKETVSLWIKEKTGKMPKY